MAATAQLEHFCGYGGKHPNTVRYHPQQVETLIYTAAAAIIIEDVNDPHKQEFLRGHDNQVTALDVSANGKLLASGQLGSVAKKGALAPVIVWDFDQRRQYAEFSGLTQGVLCVAFTPDGRFLVATGANQMLCIWDVSTSETVYSRRTESPCYLATWGRMVENPSGNRYPSYELATAYDSQVLIHLMSFDIGTMSYTLSSDPVQMPPAGLQRTHVCGIVRNGFLITGTAAGDICVFSMSSKVFRTSLPVCNNGVISLAQANDILYVAGGDGRVKSLRGYDTVWEVIAENILDAGISALSLSCDHAELSAGCRNGKLYRLLASDLTATLQAATHTDEVTSVAFGFSSETVCTSSRSGEVFLTNLSDYVPSMVVLHKSAARSVVVGNSGKELLVGYDDGSIRAWPIQRGQCSKPLWELQAHRGGVTVVRETPDYIVSAGNDCSVRFWHRVTHELLSTFTNHRKPVADVMIDQAYPHQVHSGAEDKLVVTYDLKQNKPLIQHFTQHSNITGLSQRKDRDKEVVSCSLDGKLLFWDVDYADPRGCLESPDGQNPRFRCVEVSPSGRYIAAGAEDSRLYIYDLSTCSCIQECQGHSGGITHVRWSPDQKQIVTAGKDGCVIIWNFFEL
mmetsp:Transcript_64097/g.134763  ORF Transcript_64097/g.134763 Transcript_64097/m.134763 type:complete len:623 (+) Transcript_64097:52-1920(+)